MVGAVQWLVGVALALLAVRRGQRYGLAGAPPRAFARISLLVFALTAIIYAFVVIAPLTRAAAGVLPADLAEPSARARTFGELSGAAWLLLIVAAVWNAVLAVERRRRDARAELRRRTNRVYAYRTPPDGK